MKFAIKVDMFRTLLQIWVRSKLFISLCAVAFTWTSFLFVEEAERHTYYLYYPAHVVPLWYMGFVFFSTLLTYRATIKRERVKLFLLKPLNMIVASLALLFLYLTLINFYDPMSLLLSLAPALALTSFYHFKFELLGIRRHFNFFMLKTLILALTYTYVAVLVPLQFDLHNYRFILHQFFFIFILCLLFDARDITRDSTNSINTLATFLGFRRSQLLCMFLVVAKLLLLVFATRLEMPQKIALAITDVCVLLGVLSLNEKRGELFYFLVLDGMMILQCLLFWLATA